MSKITKYNIKVYDGVLAYTHGMSYDITEYYIPEFEICINFENNDVNIMMDKKYVKTRIKSGVNKESINITEQNISIIRKLVENIKESKDLKSHLKLNFFK